VPCCVHRAQVCLSLFYLSSLFVGWGLFRVRCVGCPACGFAFICLSGGPWALDGLLRSCWLSLGVLHVLALLVILSLLSGLCRGCFLLCVCSMGYMGDIFTCGSRLSLPRFQPWENRAWWWSRFKEPPPGLVLQSRNPLASCTQNQLSKTSLMQSNGEENAFGTNGSFSIPFLSFRILCVGRVCYHRFH